MRWAETRKKARDAIHKTFSVAALYSDDQVSNVLCSVRLHQKSAYLGDDYSEFSPGLFSEINRVIVDLREVLPRRGGVFVFPELENQEVEVESYHEQGVNFALCEVK